MSANEAVARLFEEYADVLEAQGEDYRPRSYRRAAENVREHPDSIEDLAAQGEDALREIDGVGESIAAKIAEYVETGEIETIAEARAAFPVDLEEITSVEGIGPRRAGDFYRELGVTTLDELEEAAREGRIRELDGYGEKTEQNILEGVEFARSTRGRHLLGVARPIGDAVLDHLDAAGSVERCEVAGSLRRWRETIGDVDVLAAGTDHTAAVDRLREWDRVAEVIEAGAEKASVRVSASGGGRLGEGSAAVRVDLRVVDPGEWGSALQYFTGSKDHNVRLRNRAIDRDLKVNEYGVFDVSARREDDSSGSSGEAGDAGDAADPDDSTRAGERIAGETEAGVYGALDLPPIPPELREDRGEIDAAASDDLPDLVETADLRGDLHVHTDWTDGRASIAEMIEGAAEFGHDYVAVTDHATGPGVVGGMGLSEADLREQVDAIREASEHASVEVLTGVEANVDGEGGVSVADDLLADLDLVVASPHSGLDGDGTDRLVSAIAHPEVDVIGHPSGRLLHQRSGLDLDLDRVAKAAAEHDTALEVNANPHRLDLWDEAVRTAVEAGAPIAIDTDAHGTDEYALLEYGVHTARRGWAERTDVLNARGFDELRAFLD